jgi:glucan phosphoethanolaminetransferase (alkaline phosphatase superfamily)
MREKSTYDLYIFKKTTLAGACLGFAIFLFSIVESDYINSITLSFLGLGIMCASLFIFSFGMCMNLMDETADKSKGINTSPCEKNPYYFLEKKRYYY